MYILTAIADSPPTTPAVYQAALVNMGPPRKHMGANMAPIVAACNIQANCFGPIPGLYSIDWAKIPVPMIAAKDMAKPFNKKLLKHSFTTHTIYYLL